MKATDKRARYLLAGMLANDGKPLIFVTTKKKSIEAAMRDAVQSAFSARYDELVPQAREDIIALLEPGRLREGLQGLVDGVKERMASDKIKTRTADTGTQEGLQRSVVLYVKLMNEIMKRGHDMGHGARKKADALIKLANWMTKDMGGRAPITMGTLAGGTIDLATEMGMFDEIAAARAEAFGDNADANKAMAEVQAEQDGIIGKLKRRLGL